MKWFLSVIIWLFSCTGAWAQATCPVEILAIQAAPALENGHYPVNTAWQDVTLPDDDWQHFLDVPLMMNALVSTGYGIGLTGNGAVKTCASILSHLF